MENLTYMTNWFLFHLMLLLKPLCSFDWPKFRLVPGLKFSGNITGLFCNKPDELSGGNYSNVFCLSRLTKRPSHPVLGRLALLSQVTTFCINKYVSARYEGNVWKKSPKWDRQPQVHPRSLTVWCVMWQGFSEKEISASHVLDACHRDVASSSPFLITACDACGTGKCRVQVFCVQLRGLRHNVRDGGRRAGGAGSRSAEEGGDYWRWIKNWGSLFCSSKETDQHFSSLSCRGLNENMKVISSIWACYLSLA